MEQKLNFSVLDTEPKYNYSYEETTYGKDSIVSYGADNDAPLLYRDCYRRSATLKSIIDTIINYVLGDDIVVSNNEFAEKVNRSGMTMRQFIANITLDYEIYGGYAFQVIYTKLGSVAEVYPLDFARCRTNESGTKIFYSKKMWGKYTTKAEVFSKYDPEHIDPEKPTQIFYYKGAFTNNVYPFPPYYGAITDVLTEIQCSKYGLNSISNGFMARYLIQFPENVNLTDEQKGAVEKAIKTKFCSADAEASFMLYWKTSENPLDITKIESDDAPEKYINIKNSCRENIFIALHCTPLLIGLPNASNGFSTQEYSDSFKLFQRTTIKPIQDVILEGINKVIGKDAVIIKPLNIIFENDTIS